MRTKIDYGIDLGTTNSAISRMENGKPVASKQSVIIYFKLRGADTQIDIEPKDGDIIIWGYGSTKEKALTGEAHPSATSKKQ